MVDGIMRTAAEKLSSLPFVEAVVLGGSRARGTHSADSDIDIGVYYRADLFDLYAINRAAAELDDERRENLVVPPGGWGEWVNGGGWLVVGGYHVDLILRDIARVERIVEETERGVVTAHYQTGHPHGYISTMYRGELAICKVLYAKDARFFALKKRAEEYPAALRDALISFFLFEAEFSLTIMQANAASGDKYYAAGHLFRAVSCLNQVLFACNRAYCINEKKAVKMIASFPRKPKDYEKKVTRLFESLAGSLQECSALAGSLLSEVKNIASALS
ncbi:MAG: nucleotidyltransferase domain-containing protein [Clostridiales bacterium]|nr:nucleotidyltransferase domain-containing protein [Clostridiales bacterium]